MLTSLMLLAVLLVSPLPALPHAPRQSHASQTDTPPIPAARAADSYAIYDMLLPGASADKIVRAASMHWVIADTTVNIADMDPAIPPDGLLKAPLNNRRGFEGALGDFETRKYQRYRLQTGEGHLRSSLALADAEQVSSVRHAATGSNGMIFFSAVYFNPARTAALVYVNDWCAHLCSTGQWVYLEKHGGQWARRSGLVHGGG
ncbi:MAG TPA: hypothetical protein VMU92_03250 [Acidobacteriaceae bacterium]|nr:hypothetical protein [Acidobacteriaceae bacterium]